MFDEVGQCGQEFRSISAVDRAMIAAQRQVQDRHDSNGAGIVDRLGPRRADRQDGALRRVDDRVELLDPIRA